MASKIEAIGRRYNFGSCPETKAALQRTLGSGVLEAGTGEVAVAVGYLGALHQEPVEQRQEAAEQGIGRRQRNSDSLGQWCPLFVGAQRSAGSSSGNNLCIPDAKNNGFVCIAAICRLQCSIIQKINHFSHNEKGPPEVG